MANQLQKKHWTPGIKQGIAFSSLESVKKYEPEVYALFKQPLEEGARVSDGKYNYRLRRSARFGWGITRFEKTNTVSYGSAVTITKEQSQPRQQSAGTAEYEQRMTHMQRLRDELALLQEIKRKVDALIVGVQQGLMESAQ